LVVFPERCFFLYLGGVLLGLKKLIQAGVFDFSLFAAVFSLTARALLFFFAQAVGSAFFRRSAGAII